MQIMRIKEKISEYKRNKVILMKFGEMTYIAIAEEMKYIMVSTQEE